MKSDVRRIVLLGSTGSIGRQTLDVAARLGSRIQVVGLAAQRNADLLLQQAQQFDVRHIALADRDAADSLRGALAPRQRLYSGLEGLCEIASLPEADMVVVAVAGAVGIVPTHAAIQAGKTIALASKEVLVATGQITMELAGKHGVAIVPIDSEHSAILQCLGSHPATDVERLYITGSGGPFRTATLDEMQRATPDHALRHPTWSMGGLVTINSATLMNKGLEVIEAHWLFGIPADRIEVLIHPQSIVHSMVRFCDGSLLAQLGLPDMRLPIQYALLYPRRFDTALPRLDPFECARLDFEKPDVSRFPALSVAREALRRGGSMPAVMNAANEEAVGLFLKRSLPFTGIMDVVQKVMAEHEPHSGSLEAILEAERWARRRALELAGEYR